MVARDTPQICVTRCRPWILPTEGETWRLTASGVPTRPVAWGGPRPPAGQRAGGLQPLDLGREQLVGPARASRPWSLRAWIGRAALDGQVTHLLLEPANLGIARVGRPARQRGLAR